jgi:hypothetical protein
VSLLLRLATGSGRTALVRQLLVIAGVAVATALLLVATGIATLDRSATSYGGGGTCTLVGPDTYTCVDAPGSNGPISFDYLAQPGLRRGVVIGFVLCVVPLLVFLGSASRVAARARDERLAALRLAGASPGQTRALAVLDTLVGGTAGALLGTVGYLVVRQVLLGTTDGQALAIVRETTPPFLLGLAVAMLLLGGLAVGATVTLRRVVVGPLDVIRRRAAAPPRTWPLQVLGVTVAVAGALFATRTTPPAAWVLGTVGLVLVMLCLAASGAWITAAAGRFLAGRAGSPALLLAARRMQDDPRAQSRAMSSVVLVCFAATLTLGFLADARAVRGDGGGLDTFLRQGYSLVALAIAFSLVVACAGLLLTTAEGLIERRRNLARMHATGVPLSALGRATLLQVAVPTLVGAGLATACGYALVGAIFGPEIGLAPIGAWPALVPFAGLLVSLAATATTLPALGRLTGPEVLRTP